MKKSARYLWILVIAQVLVAYAALSLAAGPHHSSEARRRSALADVQGGLKTMLEMFKADCGRYPTTAEGLKILLQAPTDGSLTNWQGPYIDSLAIPEDPWEHEYVYRFPAIHSTNGYDLYSLGPDGVTKTGGNDLDDISNWEKPSSPEWGANYGETSSDSVFHLFFFLPIWIPVLYGIRLIVGVFSRRVRALMAENRGADTLWALMALAVIIWILIVPGLRGEQ